MKQITSREIISELLTDRGTGRRAPDSYREGSGLRAKEKKIKGISNRKI